MKAIRVTASPAPDYAPEFFNVLANSPEIEETRAVDWNMAADEVMTVLYEIVGAGDPAALLDREFAGVDSIDLVEPDPGRAYALVKARPEASPLFRRLMEACSAAGLVIRKPVIYRDGTVHSRVIGEPSILQAALEMAPEQVDVAVREVHAYSGDVERPVTALSDRQREAVAAALAVGYYDTPRRATHEDVAAEMGCAPNTAGEHLQKAETKLVRLLADEFAQVDEPASVAPPEL